MLKIQKIKISVKIWTRSIIEVLVFLKNFSSFELFYFDHIQSRFFLIRQNL